MPKTAVDRKPRAHSRGRLVIPTWEYEKHSTSYALGGKGCSIRRITELGFRTPPALTISTTLSRAFQETGKLSKRLVDQLQREIQKLEVRTGKRFGSPNNPLLVSVRSGAMISMPGMMDTVLNVGLIQCVYDALSEQHGKAFADECHRHLKAALGNELVFADSAWSQLHLAIMAVLKSWNSERAKAYRKEHQIPENLGTAINIQEMVFGNLPSSDDAKSSGTGVVMSHNPDTGKEEIFGEYLPGAQGHDLVSGERTPLEISGLQSCMPIVSDELESAIDAFKEEIGGPVEIEFTVECGRLSILQFRKQKLSPTASVVQLVRSVWAKRLTRDDAVEQISEQQLTELQTHRRVAPNVTASANVIGRGSGITMGAGIGVPALNAHTAATLQTCGVPYILIRSMTTPDDFPLMLGASGIITKEGGRTSHAAVVARSLGIPAVIGLSEIDYRALVDLGNSAHQKSETITVDGAKGVVYSSELPLVEAKHQKEVNIFLRWVQGGARPVIRPKLCEEVFDVHTMLSNFYMAEAMFDEKPQGGLGLRVQRIRNHVTKEAAEAFAVYLALAVSSELTHHEDVLQNKIRGTTAKFAVLSKRYSLVHRNYVDSRKPKIAFELARQSEAQVAEFFRLSKEIFAEAVWQGSSIGGTLWANIAAVGELYWSRKINAPVFVDRVFNLQHNTGYVFNKHDMVRTLFDNRILDRQLNAKRENLSLREKREALFRHTALDPEIEECFRLGVKEGVW